ncbi:MAG: DUF6065 family protein [Chloroflexota bacterium]|nr:DUF6065 family protein [Chloroflexota bacterium]
MEVNLTRVHHQPPEIRQSRPRRDWMDESYKKHAYKCLPLTVANTLGWEVLLPEEVSFIQYEETSVPTVISGLTRDCVATGPPIIPEQVGPVMPPYPDDGDFYSWDEETFSWVKVVVELPPPIPARRWAGQPPEDWVDPEHEMPKLEHPEIPEIPEPEPIQTETKYERSLAMPSIIGILSIAVDWIFNPPAGYSTFISGPPNFFMDGVAPLSAVIPGWWPDPFAMNWKITKLNSVITFPKGMPYMWFTFVKDDALSEVQFSVDNAWANPEQLDSRVAYGAAKDQNMLDNPWTWMGSVRTGLDEHGNRIGPKYEGHPVLDIPDQSVESTWEEGPDVEPA